MFWLANCHLCKWDTTNSNICHKMRWTIYLVFICDSNWTRQAFYKFYTHKMRTFLLWILSISLYYELSSAWHMQFSLRDVLKGQCRDVCPRMCKKDPNSLSSDYKCGFVCQNVCTSRIRKRRSKRATSSVCT